MDCYTERAHLLALLTMTRPARFYIDPEGEEGFTHVLAIGVNSRWLTWHISDADLPLFHRVPMVNSSMWDGHTTEEKYEHIRDWLR